ncbi:MAG: ABC transporter permease, partial [Chromatocurvus sp.]
MPELLTLAARNVLRQRGRTAMTVLAITLGVTALVLSGGFIKDTVDELADSMIYSQSGHLQVSREGYRDQGGRDLFAWQLPAPEALREQLRAVPEVEDVLLRLVFSGLLNNGRTDWAVIAEGVEPAREVALGSYITIHQGRQLAADDHYAVLLGAGVAEALDVAPGDWVDLMTNTPDGAVNLLEFEVVGTFQTFAKEYDARALRLPLPAATELLGSDGAHLAVLRLARTEDTAAVAAQLRKRLPQDTYELRDWRQLNPFYEQTVTLYQQQFGFLVLVILLMIALSVGNAINMSVHERAGELGTLLACGARQRHVFRLIVLESLLLGLLGGSFGVLLGNLLALAISAVGIPMP